MPGIQEPNEDTMADVDPTAPAGSAGSAGSTGGESPKEDDATKATREELKHTMISEKLVGGFSTAHSQSAEQRRREATPEATGLRARQADALRDQVGSPKKKRAHDEVSGDDDSRQQLAQGKTGEPANKEVDAAASGASASGPADTSNDGSGEGGRSDRAEPEKKRLRDREAEEAAKTDKDVQTVPSESKDSTTTATAKDKSAVPVATSSSAFAASGFSKLTSTTSPFGSLGAAATSGKPSLFGSASPATTSLFGTLGGTPAKPAASATPKFSFGNAAGSASPFASVSGTTTGTLFPFKSTGTTGFGATSTTGTSSGVFGSTISGPRLTSFAKPGEIFKSDKPARPFGAPESDAEENAGGGSGSGADEVEHADEADAVEAGGSDAKELEERAKAAGGDEKKKPKLQKVEINDGEKGEATLIQVRARMYYLDKDQGGWKERGAGMLKLNVPEACVQFDDGGNAIPASFDASMLAPGNSDKDDSDSDKDEDKSDSGDANSEAGSSGTRPATKKAAAAPAQTVVRLIMRQDSTHRVILNTVVLAATVFQERQTLKSTTVLFTAFEGEDAKPVNVQMKMNAANAKAFMATVGGVQKELRDI